MKVVLRPDRLGGDAALPQVGSLGRGVHAEVHEPIIALSTTTQPLRCAGSAARTAADADAFRGVLTPPR